MPARISLPGERRPHWTTFAKGERRERGVMNKTESAYADQLKARQIAGEVAWFTFEGITLLIANNCRYTPDFLVMLADGSLEIHEAKGFWAEDARVKFKCAAEKFPFRFVAVKKRAKKDGGGWESEEF